MRPRKATAARPPDALLPALGAAYIRLVARTGRWTVLGEANMAAMRAGGRPFVCAFWHARLLMMPMLAPSVGRPFTMMISANRDGEVVAKLIERFGIAAARGSGADPAKPHKDKGGARALRGALGAMRAGRAVGVTPDGPRGPAERAQPGVVRLAQMRGAAILPISYAARWSVRLRSWDRFLLPMPFGGGAYAYGTPIRVGEGPDGVREAAAALEAELLRIGRMVDEGVGRAAAADARVAASA